MPGARSWEAHACCTEFAALNSAPAGRRRLSYRWQGLDNRSPPWLSFPLGPAQMADDCAVGSLSWRRFFYCSAAHLTFAALSGSNAARFRPEAGVSVSRAALGLASIAALMGAAGVAVAALAAHVGGGEFGHLASEFLMIHAAALIGVAAHAPRAPRALLVAGYALAAGALLFSGDLTSLAFSGARLFPFAAPTGGSLMILSWLALAIVFAAGLFHRPRV